MKEIIYRLGQKIKENGERLGHIRVFGIQIFNWIAAPVIRFGLLIRDSIKNSAVDIPVDINLLINDDTFIFNNLLYSRNKYTGYCTAQKVIRGKSVRINKGVFLAAYEKCKRKKN
jgi:hypothetical protein